MAKFAEILDKVHFLQPKVGRGGYVYCKDMLVHTINGILRLVETLKSKGIEHLCTRRLTQDVIENYFAQARVRLGGKMTPSRFRWNFKRLQVLETLKIRNSNCEEEDCDETLSNELGTTIEIVEDSCLNQNMKK